MADRSRPSEQDLAAALGRHALGGARGVRILSVATTPLPGGFVSKAVDRLDLELVVAGEAPFTASFVRKACAAVEVRALERLNDFGSALAARPELVLAWLDAERPEDPDASGFVSPFYPGPTLHFGEPIPAAVITTLARLHAAAVTDDAFPTFGATRVEALRVYALAALSGSQRFKEFTTDHVGWLIRLRVAGASPLLGAFAGASPRVLVHGDMHPANLVLRADGAPVIIDWGNACLAPPMLDVANIIAIGSPEWTRYQRAYRAAGGTFDAQAAARGYWWARAIGGLMYVAWAAENSPARVPDLIAQIEEGVARLAATSGGPP